MFTITVDYKMEFGVSLMFCAFPRRDEKYIENFGMESTAKVHIIYLIPKG